MTYHFSSNGIDNYLADCFYEAEARSNNKIASSVCNALMYCVNTDRATIDFLKGMLNTPIDTTVSLCLKGGTDEEILRRLKAEYKKNKNNA